jgi:predicted site-specific integrase-resolvase
MAKHHDAGEFVPAHETLRVAVYARVSTGRQAEHDLSIPDQIAQIEAWCTARGFNPVAQFIEPGASATDDKRPEFQRMIERACILTRASSATPLALNSMCASLQSIG